MCDQWVENVVTFWFGQLSPKDWFVKSQAIDTEISQRFLKLHTRLLQSLPDECHTSPKAALAAIIVLDQFSRNMFRNQAATFASDETSLELAQATISRGLDKELSAEQRQFVYMPFMHSEDRHLQRRSIELFAALGNEKNLKFAIAHKDIIDRFGRFPHRNETLGRESTCEELEFLKQPGSSF